MASENMARWTMIVYGILMLGGGAGGYAKAHSVPSLIAGIASAVLMGTAFVVTPNQPKAGLGLALVTAIALVLVFLRRYIETHKPMNIGLMALSVLVGVIFAAALARSAK